MRPFEPSSAELLRMRVLSSRSVLLAVPASSGRHAVPAVFFFVHGAPRAIVLHRAVYGEHGSTDALRRT